MSAKIMKAAVFHGARDIRLEELPVPECPADSVMLEIAYNGICGGDLHEYEHPFYSSKDKIIFGHEFCGIIVQVGETVKDKFRVGQKAVAEALVCCDHCDSCTTDHSNLCSEITFKGVNSYYGGLAQYCIVQGHRVYPLKDSVPLKQAALIEPLAVAYHALNQGHYQPGQTVLVTGMGPVGLLLLKLLKASGAGQIIASEPAVARDELALALGADRVVNPIKEDLEAIVRQLTDGKGADLSIDVTGQESGIALNQAIKCTRRLGHIVSTSVYYKPVPIDFQHLQFGEKTLTSTVAYRGVEYKQVIEAMESGRLDVSDMITGIFPLEETVTAVETLGKEKDKHIKILIQVNPNLDSL